MFKAIWTRWRQGYRTHPFPKREPALPERFPGRPEWTPARCAADCAECGKVCPTDAIGAEDGRPVLDLGKCIFCGACATACGRDAVRFTGDYRLAVRRRRDLVLGEGEFKPAEPLDRRLRRIFGRSLKLRQVCAGGCNACEADLNVLATPVFDLARFGVSFVASPRHADGILVTGPVTQAMREALLKTYAAVPAPKLVIAVGACAVSGGLYAGRAETGDGLEKILPVDLWVPGCPPHPYTILDGILRLLGRR